MFKLWCKLKQIKVNLKRLHKEEFVGVIDKITQARSELEEIQHGLQDSSSPDLLIKEAPCIENFRKWLRVDEIALRQKSGIQWLQLGDSNHQFFFSSVKERATLNKIYVLYDDSGNKLVDPDLIQTDILAFYKKLLGTSASSLPSIHVPTVREKWA